MNAWSHLPNAPLIDWAIESLRTDPKKWNAAWTATRDAVLEGVWEEVWDVALDVADNADRDAVWNAAYNAAYNVTWNAALDPARNAALDPARNATWDVILALVVYDDCDEYLDMSYEQLLTYALLSEKPQAILLLPLKWIQENEALVTST